MTSLAEQQRQGFQDRLQRIRAGGPNTIGQVHIGPSEEVRAKDANVKKAMAPGKPKKIRTGSPIAEVLAAPLAIAFGAAAVFVGRAATFQFFSVEAPYAFQFAGMPSTMFMDFLIAGLVALAFALTFQMNYGLRRVFLLTGFVAMMVGESFVLQQYPQIFTMFYSEDFVANALANPPTLL